MAFPGKLDPPADVCVLTPFQGRVRMWSHPGDQWTAPLRPVTNRFGPGGACGCKLFRWEWIPRVRGGSGTASSIGSRGCFRRRRWGGLRKQSGSHPDGQEQECNSPRPPEAPPVAESILPPIV
jgi:hypothetical protein